MKTRSPFGFQSNATWDELFAIANQYGDWISVHTDPRWGGSFELLEKASRLTTKPILAKGIHAQDSDIERALEMGADYVLVVGRIPNVQLQKCVIEPHALEELADLPPDIKAVWNARDLSDGSAKTETYAQAREIFPGWLCQASFIATYEDIQPGADAVLIGQNLPHFVHSIK